MTDPYTVLVFSKTLGIRHDSIAAGIAMFQALARESAATASPFVVEASEDSDAVFTPANLARYRVIVLLHCSGLFLNADQLGALKGYVASGVGGVVGIHASSGALKSRAVDPDNFFGRLLGGVFCDHPAPQLGRVVIKTPKHPIVAPLLANVSSFSEASMPEPSFSVFDEWYNFEPGSAAFHAGPDVLLVTDETTYEGGVHGDHHPIAWVWNDFESTGTRVFYTALGHFSESFEDAVFVAHLKSALLWTAKAM